MLLERVLPPAAVGEDAHGDPPPAAGQQALFPAEEREIAGAGDKRRREFTTARRCARRALARLGLAPGPLPTGPTGAPVWPVGVTGSITHCDGYRAAAAARTADLAGLGIDAELHAPRPAFRGRRGHVLPGDRHVHRAPGGRAPGPHGALACRRRHPAHRDGTPGDRRVPSSYHLLIRDD